MSTIRNGAAAAATAIFLLLPAGTAFADTTTPPSTATPTSGETWQQVHAKLSEALHDRVTTLSALTASIAADPHLSSQDRSALDQLLAAETSGINQLSATVQAATPQTTTVAQLRADAKTMVDDYRVYLVMSPQVHLTEAADTETAVETTFENNESKIQARIANAGNPPDAVAAYNDLVTQVANATKATGAANIPAVLAVTPQGYPGDGAPLSAARSSLGTAHTDLVAARGDLRTIIDVIRQHDAPTAPPTQG